MPSADFLYLCLGLLLSEGWVGFCREGKWCPTEPILTFLLLPPHSRPQSDSTRRMRRRIRALLSVHITHDAWPLLPPPPPSTHCRSKPSQRGKLSPPPSHSPVLYLQACLHSSTLSPHRATPRQTVVAPSYSLFNSSSKPTNEKWHRRPPTSALGLYAG